MSDHTNHYDPITDTFDPPITKAQRRRARKKAIETFRDSAELKALKRQQRIERERLDWELKKTSYTRGKKYSFRSQFSMALEQQDQHDAERLELIYYEDLEGEMLKAEQAAVKDRKRAAKAEKKAEKRAHKAEDRRLQDLRTQSIEYTGILGSVTITTPMPPPPRIPPAPISTNRVIHAQEMQ